MRNLTQIYGKILVYIYKFAQFCFIKQNRRDCSRRQVYFSLQTVDFGVFILEILYVIVDAKGLSV